MVIIQLLNQIQYRNLSKKLSKSKNENSIKTIAGNSYKSICYYFKSEIIKW